MPKSYILDGLRSPIGKFRGALSGIRTDDLAAHVVSSLVERNENIPVGNIDDVILGCANQAGEDNRNVARMALLLAGIPWSVPGETVNRLCASGLSATVHAHRAIRSGDGDIFVTGGVEHMTRGPLVVSKSATRFGSDAKLYDSSFGWRFVNPRMHELYGTEAMGETAENLAEQYEISRTDQDQFAFWSQMKAMQARDAGRLAEEIVPVSIARRKQDPLVVEHDEFIKDFTTLDGLSKLHPAFRSSGTVTAGNASGLNDGAAALLVCSDRVVEKYGLQPKARILTSAVAGVEPRIMGIGPVRASRRVLAKAGLTLDQMDIIEINEAFAAQVLACTRELGLADDDSRINPNGGAIALGHPLGMTGARLALSAALELERRSGRYALVTMCVGVGQGYAAILEGVAS